MVARAEPQTKYRRSHPAGRDGEGYRPGPLETNNIPHNAGAEEPEGSPCNRSQKIFYPVWVLTKLKLVRLISVVPIFKTLSRKQQP
jgi:hypothetical protein